MQDKPLRLDPYTGQAMTSAMTADEARKQSPSAAWLFDPWSGRRRTAGDVFTDPLGLLIVPVDVQVPAVAIGMESNFASEADYWRGMSEFLSNEILMIAVALGVPRTKDISGQIDRIRTANVIEEATRIVDSMNAGQLLIENYSVPANAKLLADAAVEAESEAVKRLVERSVGSVPDDFEKRVSVTVNAGSPLKVVKFDGVYVGWLPPPRLFLDEGSGKTIAVMQDVVDAQAVAKPDA